MLKFRKIASVLASAVMVSSTVALAAAANYPAPFVKNGAADVAVVYGSSAAVTDLVAVADVQRHLSEQLASQTATSGSSTSASATGGDSVNLGNVGSQKIRYGDNINTGITSLSTSEMSNVLADGKVIDLQGTEYSYTQTIKPGAIAPSFANSGGDITDPALILQVGTTATAPLYNYILSLNKNLNVSDSTNVQGQKIKLLGVDYIIGASSTNTTLYLYGAGEAVTLAGGETKTVSVAGQEHTVDLVSTSSTTSAKLTVDGVSKTVTKGSSYSYAGGLNVYVKDITHPAYAGDVRNADLIIGANSLTIANGASVKSGADSTTIKGTTGNVTASGDGLISGFTIGVALPKSQTDHIAAGESYTDPVFGGLKVQFAGGVPDLNASSRAVVKVDTDNNQYAYVTFNSARSGDKGSQKIAYVYDNATASTSVSPLLAHQTVSTNGKGLIHVLEGESAQISDWIIINQGDAGTILELSDISIDTATTGTVTFDDVITGESQKITLTNSSGTYTKSGVNFFGGTGYTIRANPAGTTANITWSTAGTRTLFPRIKLKDGGWIALLQSTSVNNGSTIIFPDGLTTIATTGTLLQGNTTVASTTVNGIAWGLLGTEASDTITIRNITKNGAECNLTQGPAVLFLEPKKWNDASFGDYVCVPLSTAGSTEIAIGTPALNGTNSGFVTYNSDTYKSTAVDKYGSFVTNEQRTNENGVTTISYPSNQMYFDVLFTSDTATVTPGSSSSGTVKALGNVLYKDTESSSVSSNNLVVVGGSCINTVAASLLGSASPLCGADFTAKTGVASGQFLIQTFSRTGGKVATLVAGYNAGDTTNAAKYLTTQSVDTTVGKKYKGTTATTAEVVTETSTA